MGKKSKSALNALTHRTKMVIERISSSADVSTTVRRRERTISVATTASSDTKKNCGGSNAGSTIKRYKDDNLHARLSLVAPGRALSAEHHEAAFVSTPSKR